MKRLADIIVASAGLCVLSPVLLVIALAVRLTSPGPVLFRQKRVGIHKTHFDMYKFRTMRSDAPSEVPTHLLSDPETQITPVGRFLRKASLDELPQLWNIIRGEMSFVGPRPALWNQFDLIRERERYGANDLRPGMTGWAQVNGRDDLSIADKAALDGYYAEHMSAWMDLRCMLASIAAVVRADGVTEGAVQAPRDTRGGS